MRHLKAIVATAALFLIVAFCSAQVPNIASDVLEIKLNGNRVVASGSGSAVVTIPATTQTLIGTTTLCTVGNWCQVSVPLTNAQIKALPTTGITIVAAPGAGYRIRVFSASVRVNASAGAYTNLDATYASLQLEWGTSGIWAALPVYRDTSVSITGLSDLLTAAATKVADFPVPYMDDQYWQAPGAVLTSASDNAILRIKMDNNGTGDLTGGNAANTGLVTAYYAKEVL